MKKSDLIAVYGTMQAIGELFASVNNGEALTRSAVSQWDEDIPELRAYQLRALYPDIDKRIHEAKSRA